MPTDCTCMPRFWFHSSSSTFAMYLESSRALLVTKLMRVPSALIWLMAA